MSDHGSHHQRHLSGGDFQFHDDLASLFTQRPAEAGTPMMQQPWLADYLHASMPAPLEHYDSFAGEFDDMPPAVEELKTELAVDDTSAASAGALGVPGGAASWTAPLTPNSLSLSSTSSEACGAAAGEEAAGKCKEEEEGGESKDGSAAKGDGHMDDKNKKGRCLHQDVGGARVQTLAGPRPSSRLATRLSALLTPNSLSLSSTSSEACGAAAGEEAAGKCKEEEEGGESKDGSAAKGDGHMDDKNKKGAAKGKGKGEKRPRQPRFAFMTKSEVDHLDDGYRWRKYGQKAVKNSPFPRSYYRCTTQKCPVKKQLERSFQDAAVMVTTYEGKHTHPIPLTLRGSTHLLAAAGHYPHFRMPPRPMGGYAYGRPGATAFDALGLLQPQQHHAIQQIVSGGGAAGVQVQPHVNNAAMASSHAAPDQLGLDAIAGTTGTASSATSSAATSSSVPLRMQHFMAQDYAGLLQDMLPSFIQNDGGNNNP